MTPDDIAKMIRDRLDQLGWSDTELACKSGLTVDTTRKAATTGRVNVATMLKICRAMGLKIKMVRN
jgi:DNA-binding phage protein